eukprot:GHVQ01043069.1.p1 GENE.GHVQ01043069.1~~GHVQ01043069.1.p1  ORF type:complete len:1331 (-),score=186.19 GHVQ01043069.1:1353-5345(-)
MLAPAAIGVSCSIFSLCYPPASCPQNLSLSQNVSTQTHLTTADSDITSPTYYKERRKEGQKTYHHGNTVSVNLYCRRGADRHFNYQLLVSIIRDAVIYFEGLFGFSYPYDKYDVAYMPCLGLLADCTGFGGVVVMDEKFLYFDKADRQEDIIRGYVTTFKALGGMWMNGTCSWWSDNWLYDTLSYFLTCQAFKCQIRTAGFDYRKTSPHQGSSRYLDHTDAATAGMTVEGVEGHSCGGIRNCEKLQGDSISLWYHFELKEIAYCADEKVTSRPVCCAAQSTDTLPVDKDIEIGKGTAVFVQLETVIGAENFQQRLRMFMTEARTHPSSAKRFLELVFAPSPSPPLHLTPTLHSPLAQPRRDSLVGGRHVGDETEDEEALMKVVSPRMESIPCLRAADITLAARVHDGITEGHGAAEGQRGDAFVLGDNKWVRQWLGRAGVNSLTLLWKTLKLGRSSPNGAVAEEHKDLGENTGIKSDSVLQPLDRSSATPVNLSVTSVAAFQAVKELDETCVGCGKCSCACAEMLDEVVIRQSSGTKRTTLRQHRLLFEMFYQDHKSADKLICQRHHIAIEGPQTNVSCMRGLPAPLGILCNSDNSGYCKCTLDSTTVRFVEDRLQDIESPVSRAVVWQSLWDMVKERQLCVLFFISLAIRKSGVESCEMLLSKIFRHVLTAVRAFVPDMQFNVVAHAVCEHAKARTISNIGLPLHTFWLSQWIESAYDYHQIRQLLSLLDTHDQTCMKTSQHNMVKRSIHPTYTSVSHESSPLPSSATTSPYSTPRCTPSPRPSIGQPCWCSGFLNTPRPHSRQAATATAQSCSVSPSSKLSPRKLRTYSSQLVALHSVLHTQLARIQTPSLGCPCCWHHPTDVFSNMPLAFRWNLIRRFCCVRDFRYNITQTSTARPYSPEAKSEPHGSADSPTVLHEQLYRINSTLLLPHHKQQTLSPPSHPSAVSLSPSSLPPPSPNPSASSLPCFLQKRLWAISCYSSIPDSTNKNLIWNHLFEPFRLQAAFSASSALASLSGGGDIVGVMMTVVAMEGFFTPTIYVDWHRLAEDGVWTQEEKRYREGHGEKGGREVDSESMDEVDEPMGDVGNVVEEHEDDRSIQKSSTEKQQFDQANNKSAMEGRRYYCACCLKANNRFYMLLHNPYVKSLLHKSPSSHPLPTVTSPPSGLDWPNTPQTNDPYLHFLLSSRSLSPNPDFTHICHPYSRGSSAPSVSHNEDGQDLSLLFFTKLFPLTRASVGLANATLALIEKLEQQTSSPVSQFPADNSCGVSAASTDSTAQTAGVGGWSHRQALRREALSVYQDVLTCVASKRFSRNYVYNSTTTKQGRTKL